MTDVVGATVSFPGTQQSQAGFEALARAVQGLDGNVGSLSTRQREQQAVAQSAAQAQQAATQSAIAFGQRIAGVANAVQSLVGQLGGGGHAAGLIGATANSAVQFAQMGAAVGPQGALVGGIVGALIPALHELTTRQTEAQHAAELHRTALDDLARAADQTATLRVLNGGGTTREQQIVIQENLDAIQEAREQMRALQTVQQGEVTHLQDYAEGIRLQITGHATTDQLIQRLQDRIAQAQAQIDTVNATQQDPTGLAGLSGGPGAAGGIGGGSSGDGTHHASATHGAAQSDTLARATEEAAANEERMRQEQDLRELHAQIDREAAEQSDNRIAEYEGEAQAAQEAAAAEARADEQEKQARQRSLAALVHAQEQQQQHMQQMAQQRSQEVSNGVQSLIGDLTSAFDAMTSGQMNAAQASEMMLAGFLKYVSQMAAINALRSAADAVMAASEERWDAFATGLVATGLWAGVAVATGVGGNALGNDAQSKAAAAHQSSGPASPQHDSSAGSGKGGGNTYVIQWNSPVPMTQSQAQQAVRPLRRVFEQSERRYPNG